FLGRLDKPDVDSIEGLSPAIAIEQKTTQRNPRSTVGTVTEIYDYYRLLFARIGRAHCPHCAREIKEQTVDQIVDTLMTVPSGSRIQLLAPVVRGKKGTHHKVLEAARKDGFVRARIDGALLHLHERISLDKQKKHSIDIVVDRIQLSDTVRKRLTESVETTLGYADGLLTVLVQGENSGTVSGKIETSALLPSELFFSQKNACAHCNVSVPELQPRLFSFNAPFGACPSCAGLGIMQTFDLDRIVPDQNRSFNEGAFLPFKPEHEWNRVRFAALAEKYHFSLDDPVRNLSKHALDIILHGSGSEALEFSHERKDGSRTARYIKPWPGIFSELHRRYAESCTHSQREVYERYLSVRTCEACRGMRLKPESLAVTIEKKNIHALSALSVDDSCEFFKTLHLTEVEATIAQQILKEITDRLEFLQNVGLGYLTLERAAATLSGGEAQRIRLATQIGSRLTGVLYILDEPSIGLHQRDNERLIQTLLHLRDLGNTVLVVEHDEQTLRVADYIVDLGPGAGVHGGYVVAAGSPPEVMQVQASLTGQYLAGAITLPIPAVRRTGNGNVLTVHDVHEHNLQHISVRIRLGTFTCITGVSGSGKSTLLIDVLYPALYNRVMNGRLPEGKFSSIEGTEHLDKVIYVDQSPIGRTPRSNPATYVGVFTDIRMLFSQVPEAKMRGYKPGRFSFNVPGGRCEHCKGDGVITIEMNFLPDVYITCDVCHGTRFNRETLAVFYKGKNISHVLDMTIEEARSFFSAVPPIVRKLEALCSVGLGYVRLGQSALTLSGGEAQRVKLALELSKRATGKTLYIFDEPTTGLHFADIIQLMEVVQRLVDQGNTVVMIEHNMDVIVQADCVIDLGPEGGMHGGTIVAQGSPEAVSQITESRTGW
ncbi:excinuclease ABC subunit UvrA, partial [Treponema pallidum]